MQCCFTDWCFTEPSPSCSDPSAGTALVGPCPLTCASPWLPAPSHRHVQDILAYEGGATLTVEGVELGPGDIKVVRDFRQPEGSKPGGQRGRLAHAAQRRRSDWLGACLPLRKDLPARWLVALQRYNLTALPLPCPTLRLPCRGGGCCWRRRGAGCDGSAARR